MTKITNQVWLLAILWLVLGCKEGTKSPNVDAITTQQPSDSVESLSQKKTQNEEIATDIYTQAALETCNCLHPMVEKAKSIKDLETNNQITDMKKVAIEMSKLQPQIQKCSEEIQRKYGRLNDSVDEKKMLNALLTQCPDMATLFANLGKVAHE